MIKHSSCPNGFAAHEALHLLRAATKTLTDFFGLDLDAEEKKTIWFTAVAPHVTWHVADAHLQFVDLSVLRKGNVLEAIQGRWQVKDEARRSDLVYMKVEDDSTSMYYVLYAAGEIRDPVQLQLLREIRKPPCMVPVT